MFAFAAAQVKKALDVTAKLGGANYVLWGGREGYETLLNTDMKRELDQLGRFVALVVEHKHKIGFKGPILIEPKPKEPTKHQYDFDVANVVAFLRSSGIIVRKVGGYGLPHCLRVTVGTILGLLAIGPVVDGLSTFLRSVVEGTVKLGVLPLVSIFIEPGKVLFLNNAINHGVLDTIGVQQVTQAGKSLMFMLETNPGPGLGLLLAYWAFGPRGLRASAPGAIIIHFFGGIHEIYFPYVLVRPILIVAMILGGASGIATFVATGGGLVASPSPGSIFAELAMTPPGGIFSTLAGITVGCIVTLRSFLLNLRPTPGPV